MSRKKKHHEEHESSERWLLTYADLITLLLGLFVILYAMSKVDQGKFQEVVVALNQAFGGKTIMAGNAGITDIPATSAGEAGEDSGESYEQEKLAKQIKESLNEYIQNSKIRLNNSSEGLTIHLAEMLLFDPGSAEVKPEAKIALDQLANTISNLSNDIRIEGHTDNVPINTPQFPSNWHLSIARALNTAYYLMQNGMNPEKISIVGYSEYKPINSNETLDGRAENRRVDIIIRKAEKVNEPQKKDNIIIGDDTSLDNSAH